MNAQNGKLDMANISVINLFESLELVLYKEFHGNGQHTV